jgi:hypothetical protein
MIPTPSIESRQGQSSRNGFLKYCLATCFSIFLLGGFRSVHASAVAIAQPPLPYRIISFHQGRADMNLIRLAKEAGYNGVQIQTENGTLKPLQQFAEYDHRTRLIESCHKLGMQVSIWVHELNDIPDDLLLRHDTDQLKPGEIVCNFESSGEKRVVININDPKLWAMLDERYEYILTQLIPDVDALVLTVTETQVHATNPELFLRLVRLLDDKCKRYGKKLHVRTFVWHPEDLSKLMTTIKDLPEDVIIMSKCVPQDWHLRSINGLELGQVGKREQIEEWDVEGEYFGLNKLVNCMPGLLERQLAYGMSQGIKGICVRVDRGNQSVLHQPSEVNMWALGLLASGQAGTVDDVWKIWAIHRYGNKAGPAVVPALIYSTDVVQEAFYIENFSFFDSRNHLGPADEKDVFQHLANPQWWSDKYKALHDRLVMGDPAEITQVESSKLAALEMAGNAVVALERARMLLKPFDYDQLRRGLLANQVQLAWRAPMHLAYLRHRLLMNLSNPIKREELTEAIRKDLENMRSAVKNADPTVASDGDQALKWADEMERLIR